MRDSRTNFGGPWRRCARRTHTSNGQDGSHRQPPSARPSVCLRLLLTASGGSSTVTIIRRWECPEDGELAGWWKGPEERLVLHCGRCDTPMEKVEYVSADQLAGAVDALRELCE